MGVLVGTGVSDGLGSVGVGVADSPGVSVCSGVDVSVLEGGFVGFALGGWVLVGVTCELGGIDPPELSNVGVAVIFSFPPVPSAPVESGGVESRIKAEFSDRPLSSDLSSGRSIPPGVAANIFSVVSPGPPDPTHCAATTEPNTPKSKTPITIGAMRDFRFLRLGCSFIRTGSTVRTGTG